MHDVVTSPTTMSQPVLDAFYEGDVVLAQSSNTPSSLPEDAGMGVEKYSNTHLATIENTLLGYASFQKLMVRQAVAKRQVPTFCELLAAACPQ